MRKYFLNPQQAPAKSGPVMPVRAVPSNAAQSPAGVAASVQSPEPPAFAPEFTISAEWASRHVRDGWTRNDRPVGIAQFEFSEQIGYLGAWGVYDFCDSTDRKYRFEEARVYAGICIPVSPMDSTDDAPMMLDLNWSWLHYPDRSGEMDSAEIALTLFSDRIYGGDNWTLGYGISLIHDYDLEETSLVQRVTYCRKLDQSGDLDLEVRGELHWGDTARMQGLTRKQCNGGAFHAAVVTAALNWNFKKGWQLTPYVACSNMMDARARKAAKVDPMNAACNFWGGIRLSTRF